MSYLAGPAVLHKDGRPDVSRTGVDRILPSRPVQSSWQSPRRALRGPQNVENTGISRKANWELKAQKKNVKKGSSPEPCFLSIHSDVLLASLVQQTFNYFSESYFLPVVQCVGSIFGQKQQVHHRRFPAYSVAATHSVLSRSGPP